jgi:hypothetical protein
MIQRIQTVFLLLASAALGVQAFAPLLKSNVADTTGIFSDGMVFMKESTPSWALLIFIALLAFIAIFLFKNRKVQKILVILAAILVLADNLLTGFSFLNPTQAIINSNHAQISPGIGAFMPLISLIALLLAYRGILKDDKLVKSMDRLR